MKLLICGSRSINVCDISFLKSFIEQCELEYVDLEIIHGGAIGVDTIVGDYCKSVGLFVEIVKPDYKKYGDKAPLVRDIFMVDNCDVIFAWWDGKSTGTKYTIDYALYNRYFIPFSSPLKQMYTFTNYYAISNKILNNMYYLKDICGIKMW